MMMACVCLGEYVCVCVHVRVRVCDAWLANTISQVRNDGYFSYMVYG